MENMSAVADKSAPGFNAGLFFALCCGMAGLFVRIIAPANVLMAGLFLLVIPFVIAFSLTKDLTDTVLLVWLNEILFGGNGHWLEIGPVSGRWMLLLILISAGLMRGLNRKKEKLPRPPFQRSITFYGIWFPLWLIFYSAVLQGNRFWKALGDVNFLYSALIYFPLRRFILTKTKMFHGWMSGAILMISLVTLSLIFMPSQLGLPLFWAMAGEAVTGTTASGLTRAAFLTQVFLFVGGFWGLFVVADKEQHLGVRVKAFLFMAVSILPLSLLFLRGPLIGLILVSLLLLYATLRNRMFSFSKWLMLLLGAFSLATVVLFTQIIPEAVERFAFKDSDIAVYAGIERLDQANSMLQLFLEKPWLGQGVGTPVVSASGQERFEFELQYNMLLYRLGLINIFILLGSFAWLGLDLFRVLRLKRDIVSDSDGRLMLSVLLSIFVIFIAGAMNPYLAVVYTTFLIVLYLSYRELVVVRPTSLSIRALPARR